MLGIGAKPELLITGADMAELAAATGRSDSEIRWAIGRVRELRRAGKGKEERLKIVLDEAQGKPWLR